MKRKRIKLDDRAHRALLSDTLPFELPICFSNRHLFSIARDLDVTVSDGFVRWLAPDNRADGAIRLLFNIAANQMVSIDVEVKNKKQVSYRKMEIGKTCSVTIPFQFDICHRGNESRTLTVPHPRSQIAAAAFLDKYSSTIMYYCGLSEISIRAPSSVSRYTYYDDRLHQTLLASGENVAGPEEHGREYDKLGSFYVYKKYNNVYKFFESQEYHKAEKRFNAMVQLDISRCFDSIYTHSLAWALLGKPAVKARLGASNQTFPGLFDELIRSLNHNETNGIVIGPEFSRIYAECLLQQIDGLLIKSLKDHSLYHKRDYKIFRYLDDYFVFFNDESTYQLVFEYLSHNLSKFKLALNAAKIKRYDKPIITELTIAKNKISQVLSEGILAHVEDEADALPHTLVDVHSTAAEVATTEPPTLILEDVSEIVSTPQIAAEPRRRVRFEVDSRKVIIRFKTALKEAGVSYLEIGNYAFALLENSIANLCVGYGKANPEFRTEDKFATALMEALEVCFFVYAATPRVNLSIRLVRIVNNVVEYCNGAGISKDRKHEIFKMISDNLVHQVRKNKVLRFKEVENLYLILGLACLGRSYWLEEDVLADFLGIEHGSAGYHRKGFLNYFTLTTALFYMREKVRYNNLRAFIVEHAAQKMEARKAYRFDDGEMIMLFLDLVSCPYVDDVTKDRIAALYDFQRPDWLSLNALSPNWFTSWRGLKIGEALDAKRSRDVY